MENIEFWKLIKHWLITNRSLYQGWYVDNRDMSIKHGNHNYFKIVSYENEHYVIGAKYSNKPWRVDAHDPEFFAKLGGALLNEMNRNFSTIMPVRIEKRPELDLWPL